MQIHSCTDEQFNVVKQYLLEYELDNRTLIREEFVVAIIQNSVVGFGRVREFQDFSELCSLGVIINERRKGIGKKIFMAMIKKASKKPFLACIIPEFFYPFGFEITHDYPYEMFEKLHYCTDSLPVDEKYVIMTFKE